MDREQLVRERAFTIWEGEGCPSGCEQEHWERAEREIDRERSGAPGDNGSGAGDRGLFASSGETDSAIASPGPRADAPAVSAGNLPARRSGKRKASKTEA